MKNFDLDLNFGLMGEAFVKQVIEERGFTEVKTEREQWEKTGNIAIEIGYKGKPSGLSTTDAKVWVHNLVLKGKVIGGFIISVRWLKERIEQLKKEKACRIIKGGDDCESEFVLIPVNEVFVTRKMPWDLI